MTFPIFDTLSYTAVQLLPACIALSLYFLCKRVIAHKKAPPCYGWIPWLGCAVEFGNAPLLFINDIRKRVRSHCI